MIDNTNGDVLRTAKRYGRLSGRDPLFLAHDQGLLTRA